MAKTTRPRIRTPLKSSEVPVTQSMLYLVRDELKADYSGFKVDLSGIKTGVISVKVEVTEIKTELAAVKTEISLMKSDMAGLKNEVASIKTEIKSLHEKIESVQNNVNVTLVNFEKKIESKMDSHFHRLALLIEEQNARNIYVLDGLNMLFDRQERIEKELKAR